MLGLALSAYATPVYLTFEGDITSSNSSSTITSPSAGAATIVIMADLAAPGHKIVNGTNVDMSSYNQPGYYNYFQADYVSSPTFTGGAGNVINYDYSYGFEVDPAYYGEQGYIFVVSPTDQSTFYNYVEITNVSSGYTSFSVGQTYTGEGYAQDYTSNGSKWLGTFTLTDISDTSPAAVPEPGTLALFGMGMIGLAGAARWRKTRKA